SPPSSIQLTPIPAKLSFVKPFSTSIYYKTVTSTNPPPCHNIITSQAYSQSGFNFNPILLHQFKSPEMSEGRTKVFLRKLRSAASTPINETTTTTTASSSSSSSSTSSFGSQKPFRAIYTVDHCGYDLPYRCS